VFFLNGFGVASWVVRIPAVQSRLGLSAGTLGVVLLGTSVGALVAMPLAGRFVVRRGSRSATRAGVAAFALSLLPIAFAPSAWALAAALVLFGAANGTLDVAMNAQAATVDRHYLRGRGRPVMASFHALFSAGGLAGSALGGVIAGAGVPLAWHMGGAMLVIAASAPFATRLMIADEADGAADAHGARPTGRPVAALVPLGVLAFCVLFQEGAMADWTAVYLRDVAHTGPGLAAAGYAGFSITMATGRAVGDRLMAHLGPSRLVRLGGVAATVGAALAVLVPVPAAAVVGFACIGAGLASAFPAVLAASSRTPGVAPGAGIAFVSTLGYTGFLAGPPLIGFVAELATLRAGIAVVAGAGVLVALLAGALGRVTTPRPAS
jgi:MFS family permease